MIERIIEASARNKFLVFIFTIFASRAAFTRLMHTPLDAIPDLSDVQVIVYTDWEGRSPDLVEDQITYPISTRFIAAPKVKFVRGESMFGKSFVYVIFRGRHGHLLGALARHRISQLGARLVAGRRESRSLAPTRPASAGFTNTRSLTIPGNTICRELRSFQDWNLRYALESVKGVSEVAPVGGFVKQYQVDLDPNKLVAYNIPLSDVVNAIRNRAMATSAAKIFEVATTEYFVRGRGYIKSIADIENIVLKVENGTPVYVKNVGTRPSRRRHPARRRGAGRQRRSRRRHCRHALRRERAQRHRRRQKENRRNQIVAAGRGARSSRPTIAAS